MLFALQILSTFFTVSKYDFESVPSNHYVVHGGFYILHTLENVTYCSMVFSGADDIPRGNLCYLYLPSIEGA